MYYRTSVDKGANIKSDPGVRCVGRIVFHHPEVMRLIVEFESID